MLLTEWGKKRAAEPDCKGVYTELSQIARVNYRTARKAIRDGVGIKDYETAERMSKATGGVCSIDEIRHPERYQRRGKKTAA